MRTGQLIVLVLIGCSLASPAIAAEKAAILQDDLPGLDLAMARELGEAVGRAGYEVTSISADELSDEKAFTAERFDLLVAPNARAMPLRAIATVQRFMEQGGDVIACGLPAWEELVVKVNGKWLTRQQREALLRTTRVQNVRVDFGKEDLAAWKHASDLAQAETTVELAATDRGKALHVVVPQLSGWDTLLRDLPDAFAKGHAVTCFRAKGGPRTAHMLVEWVEKDGSRWIATIDLTTQWKEYALGPEAFVAWQPPRGRGGRGDHLRTENAARFGVGLARSHAEYEGGKHEYWFAGLGTAVNPSGEVAAETDVPHIEGISPGYLFFPVSGTKAILSPIGPYPDGKAMLKLPLEVVAMHPRPGRGGFDKDRVWRWEPLLYATTDAGGYGGAVAAMIVPLRKPYLGSASAVFTPAEPSFYRQDAVRVKITEVARSIRRGVFLAEGGSAFYTVFDHQSVVLGAKVVRIGKGDPGQVSVRITATPANSDKPAYERTWAVKPGIGDIDRMTDTWKPAAWQDGAYRVVTELFVGGNVVERIDQELHVWRAKSEPRFIESRDGGFWLGGKPWKAHGVNYMPSSGVGQANYQIFEHWLGAAGYDPEVIERDLRRINAMNMNSVSVFIDHQSLPAQNMLDFLRRCEAIGLYVNLSLRPGTPMDFQWAKIREMIEKLRLRENDALFAYDLAWEPSHYTHEYQKRYVPAWKEWIGRRHGSIQAAEKAWGVAGPSEDGQFSVPEARQLIEDGPWRKMVADYRLFLDDMLREKYAEARRLVKSVDPNHAVSFRMQLSGDPTIRDPNVLPYDFYGLADAVDIWEPEAYGRIGDWERVKPGHFTAAYARLCDPKKPVLWAEMGVSVWDNTAMRPRQEGLAFQASYYRDFYRMMIQSGADGIFYWWYPGGYRVNEKSDYGIINPDGSDRPVTKVICQEAGRFLSAAKPGPVDYWISVDRDRDARGLYGMYEAVKKEYWDAVDKGKVPALKWEHRPGTGR